MRTLWRRRDRLPGCQPGRNSGAECFGVGATASRDTRQRARGAGRPPPPWIRVGQGTERSGVIARGRSGGGPTASPPLSPTRHQTGRSISATPSATRVAPALGRRPPNRMNRIRRQPSPGSAPRSAASRLTGSATAAGLGARPPREGVNLHRTRDPRGACRTLMRLTRFVVPHLATARALARSVA
jgi:hypothetical protein